MSAELTLSDCVRRYKCPACGGSGTNGWLPCQQCDGHGRIAAKPLTLEERVKRLETQVDEIAAKLAGGADRG